MRRDTLAKKKETTMSQMTSLQKALKHCAKVRVLVATTSVPIKNAHAPVGSGSRTRPALSDSLIAEELDLSIRRGILGQ